MQDRNRVALPLAALDGQPASLRTLQVLKRFEFDPALTRSGVIVHDKSPNGALLFVRGAPHKVVGLVRGGALPSDFDQVHHVLRLFGPDCSTCLDHVWAMLLQHTAHLHAVTIAMSRHMNTGMVHFHSSWMTLTCLCLLTQAAEHRVLQHHQ